MEKHGYIKCGKIDSGAYASIYLVKKDNIFYVSKEINENNDMLYQLTMNEINILKHCQNPLIPYYKEHFKSKNNLCLIMEHCGTDLLQLLKTQYYGCFSQLQLLYYAKHILSGLSYLHSQGITHCDIKLENVLVNKLDEIKIIDYNLSIFEPLAVESIYFNKKQITRPNNKISGYCGTIEYIAPEVINNQEYTYMVDWWAFGILIYELLYGVTPFNNQHENNIKRNITSGAYQLKDETLY